MFKFNHSTKKEHYIIKKQQQSIMKENQFFVSFVWFHALMTFIGCWVSYPSNVSNLRLLGKGSCNASSGGHHKKRTKNRGQWGFFWAQESFQKKKKKMILWVFYIYFLSWWTQWGVGSPPPEMKVINTGGRFL